jgi:hypothetical protein
MLLTQYDDQNTTITLTSSGADQQLAQGFQFKRDANIGRVYLHLSVTGTPGGYLQIEIQSDDSGVPSGTAIDAGASEPILVSEAESGTLNAFHFDLDDRPAGSANTQYHIVLKSGAGYTQDASNYVAIGGDQTTPHYTRGAGSTYDGADWTTIATDTDFTFSMYSGTNREVYSVIREVEALTRHLTNAGKYDSTTVPTSANVMDFEESVSAMIDGWLKGAGVQTPITSSDSQKILRNYANYCVALNCEMTQRTAGFRSQESDTRAAAFRNMCYDLKRDTEKNGPITKTIKGSDPSSSAGLTCGMIDVTERENRQDDDTIIQPRFEVGMFDNLGESLKDD